MSCLESDISGNCIDGKVALVTGAGSGIGRMLASPMACNQQLAVIAMCIFLFFNIYKVSAGENIGGKGVLQLEVEDAETGKLVPARLEVLGPDGKNYLAKDALPIGGACGETRENGEFAPIEYDGASLDDALARFTQTIEDPFSESTHFYTVGKSKMVLPPGIFKIKVYKGPEYKRETSVVTITAGETVRKTIPLSRFTNMPAKGWYSADGHLHIARITREVDPLVLKMMQAEDIHVGNLLQMGRADTFLTTQQYAHGEKSRYQEGNYLIISGQENLRTHLLAHTVTLGAAEPIFKPEKYLLYKLAWQQAADQGALNGYAHFGKGIATTIAPGLPVLAPHNLMHFMEVLQFNQGRYSTWYDMLNLGFRITPTAGTDYPCIPPDLPGKERFYTKVEGPFTYKNWLEGVRAGRTFVTTGPMLEFGINGQDIGSEIVLDEAEEVTIKGVVRDPNDSEGLRGRLKELELVENGRVIRRFPRVDNSDGISFEIRHKIKETSWLALRTSEAINVLYPNKSQLLAAHSAPIYVTLKNAPPISEHIRTRAIAKDWLSSLESLEDKLSEANIGYLKTVKSPGDPIPPHIVMNNHLALLEEIENSKLYFSRFLSELTEMSEHKADYKPTSPEGGINESYRR